MFTTVLHPTFFIPSVNFHRSVSSTLGTSDVASRRSNLWGLRVGQVSFFRFARRSPGPFRVSHTVRCSNQTSAPSRNHNCMPGNHDQPTAEIHLYQSWRAPSWLLASQLQSARKNIAERNHVSCFANLKDVAFRILCMGFVFAYIGCSHYLYDKADQFARKQVQIASAHLNTKVSTGRVVRCNPLTGIRVKDVLVLKSSQKHVDPLGKASYVHGSISGYAGLIFHKRPLEVSIIVSHGEVIISDLVAKEYGRDKLNVPNLQEPIYWLATGWRTFPIWTSSPLSRLVKPGTVSFIHSRLRIEGIQQGPTGDFAHSVDIADIAASLDLRNQNHEPLELERADSQAVIEAKGTFLNGGHACLVVQMLQHGEGPKEASVSSVNASLRCSRVNIGSIASFMTLPFKAKDGTCTGNLELRFSPTGSHTPYISGQAEVRSLGLRFDPNPESPELCNLMGKLRFRPNGVVFDYMEGELGSIPLEATGHIDLNEGFKLESHARPFDVNKVIETFDLHGFIPLEGSVIGKAVVRGDIDEPCVSGWLKAVGNRAMADRILLKSAMMTYDWDVAAGNLLFPSIRATVVGGGELMGSGGIYFDMTQQTRYGCWNEKHHMRNPKATYWNTDESVNKTLPPLPRNDFEIDRWAPFRPYDSMDFEINGSEVCGENLIQWYGRKFGSIAVDAVGRIGGFCRISGHTQNANSRLIWRAVSQNSSRKSNSKPPPVPLPTDFEKTRTGSNEKDLNLNSDRNLEQFEATGAQDASIVSGNDSPRDQATSNEENRAEYLGGLVYVKLGDLPEARRIKARTTLKGFEVKRLLSADPHFREILAKAPNAIASMDTLFKGTLCMRPSWGDERAKKGTRNTPLDLVSVDGGLAIRNLSLNGVVFRKVISGSLSLSATDVSLSLSDSSLQETSPGPIQRDYQHEASPSERALEVLEVKLNTRGFFYVYSKWDDSEVSASMFSSDGNHRILQLFLNAVDLQELSGGCNPLIGDEHIQGILTASIELDCTCQEGHMYLSLIDLALGSVRFELVNGQLSLKDGEITLYDAMLEQGLSKYKLEGKHFLRENSSGFEWYIDVNLDRAFVGDVSHLLDSGMKMLTCDHGTLFANCKKENDCESRSFSFQSGTSRLQKGSSATLWKVPENLIFAEQMKWFTQSITSDMDPDIASLFAYGDREEESYGVVDSKNSFSGRITIYHPSKIGRRRQRATRNSRSGPLPTLRNITLSFDLHGRDWILHNSKIEGISVSGLLEDGSLSIHPLQIKGEDGLLIEGQCSFTNNGSIEGSLGLHGASASSFDIFQRAGLDAAGVVEGNLGVKGNVSNPTCYGQVLWRNARINGKIFSHPHADIICSNGRCVINIDAIMTGHERKRQRTGSNYKVSAADTLQSTANHSKTSTKKSETENVSSPWGQDTDSVTARLSLPARLLMRRRIQPWFSKIFPQDRFSLDQQHSFDDDWVFARVNVRRYGMMLLNVLIPDIGWIGGDSDVAFQVSGTKSNPELLGSVNVRNGNMHPPWMTQPIKSLAGEIELRDSGLIVCKALSGRCNGRAISLRGGIFLSSRYSDLLEERLRELQRMAKSPNGVKKKKNRGLETSLHEAEFALRAGRDGIWLELGGIPIQVPKDCTGTVSGKLLLTGTLFRPRLKGSLVFSEGIINANGSLTDVGRHGTALSQPNPSRLTAAAHVSKEPQQSSQQACDSNDTDLNRSRDGRHNQDCEQFCVHMENLKLSLGRNVRVVHSFLFNVFANGSISISGSATSPSLSGKIRIVSGNVSALPTRWNVRKSESSYILFARDPVHEAENQEPTIKLVLESDTVILRVAECAVSSWMSNISISDKAGIRTPEKWWADAIHMNEDENRHSQKITKILTGLMINALAVGGNVGKYALTFFPTYLGDTFPEISRQLYEKYGAGIQVDHDNFCFESNVFADKYKGCQIMLKVARATTLHLFGDKSRRSASFELKLPGGS